jgi:endonuclease/exonuclease/phosphatase family metal-dependent hydrolase
MFKALSYTLSSLALVITVGLAWIWHGVRVPEAIEIAPFYCSTTQAQPSDQITDRPLKVLSFNVQYMAGKSYIFFYDIDGGPDSRPSNEDISLTTQKVADILRSENADIVLLQEINDAGDVRTHNRDQLAELQLLLTTETGRPLYPCYADAHYWQADFIPHPKVLGPVSMKLTTLSKYPIHTATRHQLPLVENNAFSQHFYFHRAILETAILLPNQTIVSILNTHFDAWGAGTQVNQQQIAATQTRLDELNRKDVPWILGGDLNILPPDGGHQQSDLSRNGTGHYDKDSALNVLYQRYGAVPPLDTLQGENAANWYTHLPNNPKVNLPDRTLDYLFYSKGWGIKNSYVRQHDTLTVSDHLPIVGEFVIKARPLHGR